MRLAQAIALAAALASPSGATAEELVAVRPGVMCESASALSDLTLHSGDSRTHVANPRALHMQLARWGGCIDIPPGARVTVLKTFRNTSLVNYPPVADRPMTIPNIDFRPLGDAASNSAGAPDSAEALPAGYRLQQKLPLNDARHGVVELLEDRRITPAVRASILRDPAAPGGLPDTEVRAAFKDGAPLDAQVRVLSRSGEVVSQTTLGQPLAELQLAGVRGLSNQAFFVRSPVGRNVLVSTWSPSR